MSSPTHPRTILYTGKGGVGKSTIAAATAVRTAELGRRTLLVSSDLAHNISDIFAADVGGESTGLAERLTALEIDALREIRAGWAPAQDYFTALLVYLGMEDAVAEELALIPGLEELFLMTRILREVESGHYDVIVIDCAPTADAMRLFTMSDTASTKLSRVSDAKRKTLKLLRPILNRIRGIKHFVPDDELFDVFDDLLLKAGRLGEILKDPATSSVRLVLNPNRVAIAETRRAFTYFGLFGFAVDAVVVNKILPPELSQGYLNRWRQLEQSLLESIDQSFLDVTRLHVPLLAGEPIGHKALSDLAGGIFRELVPDGMLSSPRPVALEREDGAFRLVFQLPTLTKSDLKVGRKDGELILSAGGYTRVFSLPDTLQDREIGRAKFDRGELIVSFQ